MRGGRKLGPDGVARTHLPTGKDDCHDACLADEVLVPIPVEHCSHEARLDTVELRAWVAQAGDLDHGAISDAQPGARRQPQQVDPARGDVLAHLAVGDPEAGRPQLVLQLTVDEMDLTQVRPAAMAPKSGSVLHRRPHVHVSIDPKARQQPDLPADLLGHRVPGAGADALDCALQVQVSGVNPFGTRGVRMARQER